MLKRVPKQKSKGTKVQQNDEIVRKKEQKKAHAMDPELLKIIQGARNEETKGSMPIETRENLDTLVMSDRKMLKIRKVFIQ